MDFPSVNVCLLVGRVEEDPQIRHLQDGKMKAEIRLLTQRQWGDRVFDERHSICVWGNRAGELGSVTKGAILQVTGDIRHRSYENKDGVRVYKTELNSRDLTVLSFGPQHKQPAAPDDGEDLPF